jgi:hypothetical protein
MAPVEQPLLTTQATSCATLGGEALNLSTVTLVIDP